MDEKDKKDYEITFLAKDEKGGEIIREAILREGGEILLENPIERINLAYKIEKETSALFSFFHFSMSPSRVPALESDLRMKGDILRSLIVTPPFQKNKQRNVPRSKSASPSGEAAPERKAAPSGPSPLSNEALEKKIEEILQQ